MIENIRVLVLNQTYEPINVCNAKRAIRMMLLGKVEIIEADGFLVRSERVEFHLPVVIRLRRYVKITRVSDIPFSKKNIYRRDNFTCQYCGQRGGGISQLIIFCRGRGAAEPLGEMLFVVVESVMRARAIFRLMKRGCISFALRKNLAFLFQN